MAIDDPGVRVRLRRKLKELVGVEEADLLMDRPPGGWSALVTNETLDLKLGALEARMNARFETIGARFERIESRFDGKLDALRAEIERGFRMQTWRLLGAVAAFSGVLVAAVRV